MAAIPLFPLGTVLVPGAELPLRIFEPRYVAMLRDLITDPEQVRPFGVVAIRQGVEVGTDRLPALHAVGCAAELEQLAPIGEDQYALVGRGARRFRIEAVDTAAADYLVGTVSWLDEPIGDRDQAEAGMRILRELLPAYWDRLGLTDLPSVTELPDDPVTLSYATDKLLVLDVADRQRLLAAPDAATRLAFAAQLLRRESALLQRVRAVPTRLERPEIGLN